jgi:hypothetical protein
MWERPPPSEIFTKSAMAAIPRTLAVKTTVGRPRVTGNRLAASCRNDVATKQRSAS